MVFLSFILILILFNFNLRQFTLPYFEYMTAFCRLPSRECSRVPPQFTLNTKYTLDYSLLNYYLIESCVCIFLIISLLIRLFPLCMNSVNTKVSVKLFPSDVVLLFLIFIDKIDVFILLVTYHDDFRIFNSNSCHSRYSISQLYTLILMFLSRTALLMSLLEMLPSWLVFIRLIVANDVETNPGDYSNSFFTFCNWNINSLAKDNFQRVQLLEAHNTLFDYDLISLCETSLNDTVPIPDPLLKNYTFISNINLDNTRY